jgi:hypothetical protein
MEHADDFDTPLHFPIEYEIVPRDKIAEIRCDIRSRGAKLGVFGEESNSLVDGVEGMIGGVRFVLRDV